MSHFTDNELQLLKALLSWPFILFVVAVWFRSDIKTAIQKLTERLESVKSKNVHAKFTDALQVGLQEANNDDKNSKLLIPKSVRKTYEDKIQRAKRTNKQLEEKLAEITLQLEFEKIYKLLFGTQIELLKELNVHVAGVAPDLLQPYIDQHIKTVSDGFKDITGFTGYPLRKGLISLRDSKYFITDKGKSFLEYLTREGYRENVHG